MIDRVFRRIYLLHFFVSVALLSLVGVGTWYFIVSGIADGDKTSALFEASKIIDSFQRDGKLAELKSSIESNKIQRAAALTAEIGSDIKNVSVSIPTEEAANLLIDSAKLQKSLTLLTVDISITDLIKVLDRKMRKFNLFVEENSWRTLTRISRRIIARTERLDEISFSRFRSINRSISQDMRIMKKVTQSSSLSSEIKKIILLRLKSLMTEVQMFKQYLVKYSKSLVAFKNYQLNFNSWYSSVSPEVSIRVMELEKIGKRFLLCLIGMFAILLFGSIAGFLILRRSKVRSSKELESETLELFQRGVVAHDPKIGLNISAEFKSSLGRLNLYVRRAMNFGDLVKSALPFPAATLDSNMKVTWANDIFCQEWGILAEDIDKDLVSWDYLERFINLENTNPVRDALDAGVAGIYQIELQSRDSRSKIPFEMYVCPDLKAEEEGSNMMKSAILFFYPLSAFEDTIAEQSRSIITPIEKAINTMLSDEFDTDFQNEIKPHFEDARIMTLFDKLVDHDANTNQQRKALIDEIDEKDGRLQDDHKQLHDIKDLCHLMEQDQSSLKKNLIETRDSIIRWGTTFNEMSENRNRLLDLTVATVEQSKIVSSKNGELLSLIESNQKSVPEIEGHKENIKQFRTEYCRIRESLMENIDQTMMLKRSVMKNEDGDKVVASLEKIKHDAKELDNSFMVLERSFKQLDIYLTKTKMAFEKSFESYMGEKKLVDFERVRVSMELLKKQYASLEQNREIVESELISKMGDLYHDYKNLHSKREDTHSLLINQRNIPENELIV